MTFHTFPPADGTYQLEPHIVLGVRRRPTPTEARAAIRVYVSGFVDGSLMVKTRTLSVHTNEQFLDRMDEAREYRSQFLRMVGKSDVVDEAELARMKVERLAKAEEQAKLDLEERRKAEQARLLIVVLPARKDVHGVWERYGPLDPVAKKNHKPFQWIA